MPQNQDIAKIEEIKGKFNTIWLSSEYLQAHLNILGSNKIKSKFSWCKKAGFSFEDLIATLLVLPLTGMKTIYGLATNKVNSFFIICNSIPFLNIQESPNYLLLGKN